jgi:hypothetical protein
LWRLKGNYVKSAGQLRKPGMALQEKRRGAQNLALFTPVHGDRGSTEAGAAA